MDDEDRRRLFFALWPPTAVREALARLAVAHVPDGRRLPAENLHLTLAFIGEADATARERLLAVAAAVHGEAATLHLERLGCWPRQGISWAAPERVPEALQHLHRDLNRRLKRAGFRAERRPFRPHVTLARRSRPHAFHHFPVLAWRVDAFALVASTLGAEGARYRIIAQWPLGGCGRTG